MNCSCFLKDWQLRVFLETHWNLDLDIRKILQLLNLWGLLDNNLCPFFTLRGPQPLGWLEFYRLNVNCFSQACMLYSWSTVLSDFGKIEGQYLYERNRPWGLFSREYFILSTCLYPCPCFLSTRIWTVPVTRSCCLAALPYNQPYEDRDQQPWTETSVTERQRQHLPDLNCFHQIFCHRNVQCNSYWEMNFLSLEE